jgi:hypothetical protein
MKFKYRLLILPFLIGLNCYSQENTDIISLTKLTFLDPGISREIRIAPLQSVFLQAFMATSAYFSYSSTFGTNGGVYFDPAAKAQYRYYYNMEKRVEKEKRTERNSMNYVGGSAQTVFTDGAYTNEHVNEDERRPVNTIGIIWGLQRNGAKHFSFDLNLGVGYLFGKGTKLDETGLHYSSPMSEFTGIVSLNLGFWLTPRK